MRVNSIFFKVLTVVYLFLSMGFSYQAFTAPNNSLMLLNIVIAVYFIFRTSYMFERSKEVEPNGKKLKNK